MNFFHPPSLHLAIYFMVYLLVLLIPNSYTIFFWEFYFLPFCVHVQTNIIYDSVHCWQVFVGLFTLARIRKWTESEEALSIILSVCLSVSFFVCLHHVVRGCTHMFMT
jgi:hypothetical protein